MLDKMVKSIYQEINTSTHHLSRDGADRLLFLSNLTRKLLSKNFSNEWKPSKVLLVIVIN